MVSMKKRLTFSLVVFCLNLSVVLLVGETYARLKHGDILERKSTEVLYRKADLQLHHSFIPGSEERSIGREWDVAYRINSFGLRDREYSIEKPENTYRILALGDSFTEGYGMEVEDAFVKILEKKLNSSSGSGLSYEVINGGIASYSPLLEYLFLVQKGLRLNPDMVILFYDFSDLKDDYEYEKTALFGKDGAPFRCFPMKRVRALSSGPFERFLIRHCRFYLYAEDRINKLLYKFSADNQGKKRELAIERKRKYDLAVERKRKDDIPLSLNEQRAILREQKELVVKNRFVAFQSPDGIIVEKLWEKNEKYIGLIHEMLKERGISFVLVTYPYAVEVGRTEWSEGRGEYGFKEGIEYPQPSVVSFLRRYAEEKDIPFINLYYDFLKSDLKPLYFAFDGHFTENGHKVAAESLFRELGKLGDAPLESTLIGDMSAGDTP